MSGTPSKSRSIVQLAKLFLKLGVIGFGGPAAHIAMMEDEVVRRRGWLSHNEFLDLLGATNLIPGPNSTEMAIHIGHRRAGWAGLAVAGICFIAPAMLIVLGCSWAYVQFGTMPQVAGILYGVKPVIIAIVVQALWVLSRSALKSIFLAIAGAGSLLAAALGYSELLILFLTGGLVAAVQAFKAGASRHQSPSVGKMPLVLPAMLAASGPAAAGAASFSMTTMFLFFLKVGSILFGSGYVLLAFLRADLVERWGWLTEAQLLDAIVIGQVTPGPVFTTATFIGYVLGGTAGAIIATVGIFLPAFAFVALSGPLVPLIRKSPSAGAFLDGVIVASLALMMLVTWHLAREAIVDPATALLALASAFALLRFKLNSAWLVGTGAVAGLIKVLF